MAIIFLIAMLIINIITSFVIMTAKRMNRNSIKNFLVIFFFGFIFSFGFYFVSAILGFYSDVFGLASIIIGSVLGGLLAAKILSRKTNSKQNVAQSYAPKKDLNKTNSFSFNNVVSGKKNTTNATNKQSTQREVDPEVVVQGILQKIDRKTFYELKDLIAENKLDKVIDRIKLLIKEGKISDKSYNELVILKSRLNKIKASVRKGVLSLEEENLEVNKIRGILLEVIDALLEG